MKVKIVFNVAGALLLTLSVVQADVLELKNGKVLNGTYVGGSAGTIRFETSQGVQVIETGQALALTFTGAGATPATAAPVAAAPTSIPAATTPGAAASSVSVAAGTTLLVRMLDGASSNDAKGKRFTTTLETDLQVNGRTVAKAGTKVYGRVENVQKAGRYVGQSVLDIRLTEITVNGALIPISTGPYAQAGSKSVGKTARGAAAGAAIGAIAGDAGKGAAIGAAASGVKKGQAIVVQPGTVLEFQLQQPLAVNITG
jgi:hypothetical protein